MSYHNNQSSNSNLRVNRGARTTYNPSSPEVVGSIYQDTTVRNTRVTSQIQTVDQQLIPYNNELQSGAAVVSSSAAKSKSKDLLFILTNNNLEMGVRFIFETLANKRGKKTQDMLKDGLTFNSLYNQLQDILSLAKQIVEGTAGDDRKNFGTCKCTNPPSLGFCVEGLCIKANFNFTKLEGSLSITIPF